MSPHSCVPCGRSFENEGALTQHLRHSQRHRTPSLPQPQNPPQTNPHPRSSQIPNHLQSRPSQSQNTESHQHRFNPRLTSDRSHTTRPANLPYVGGATFEMASRPPPTRPTPTPSQNRNYGQFTNNHQRFNHTSNGNLYHAPQIISSAALSNIIPSWSSTFPDSENELTLSALSAQCHSLTDLRDNSYIVDPYDAEEYKHKRKCQRCYGREHRVSTQQCVFHSFKRNKYNVRKPYKCCDTIDGPGCQTLPKHDFRLSLRAISHKDFLPTPAASPSEQKLQAVVFDCEMAGIASGAGETILLCASDYFTGKVIVHKFVNPAERITQMRDEVHGISKSSLNAAVSQGEALSGWTGTRAELWKFIDANTILIGHALQNDLDSLRMIHHRIVDSGIMARKAVGINRIQWSLSSLCEELLKQEIRKSERKIHECLEDVMATREVVLFCTRKREEFLKWAKETRIKELALEAEREKAREEKKKTDLKAKEEETRNVAAMTVAERAVYWSKK